jgi:hypothetical protein
MSVKAKDLMVVGFLVLPLPGCGSPLSLQVIGKHAAFHQIFRVLADKYLEVARFDLELLPGYEILKHVRNERIAPFSPRRLIFRKSFGPAAVSTRCPTDRRYRAAPVLVTLTLALTAPPGISVAPLRPASE